MYDRIFRTALIRRSENGGTPEGRLAAAVICQAFEDAWVGEGFFLDDRDGATASDRQEEVPIQADAESFFSDGRLDCWCDALGIAPAYVRRLCADAMSQKAVDSVEALKAA